ncbi:unnamed protein product [Owenia fusiformis]|uniref:PIH1 domain-containing protein 1 n=1 Tax=Owenia fusiformis TaxID=6347 RepID=A0A8J1TCC2_OWEFU|nr:unnamed protein product [Owenia fusiformis]
MASDQSLLFPEEDNSYDKLFKLKTTPQQDTDKANQPAFNAVRPDPGFCLKTKIQNSSDKVFINVCRSTTIPAPKDITEEELLSIIESPEPGKYRVPMSIGEPHTEQDKSGQECTAYDVIIHKDFYEKVQTKQVFQGFFLTIVLEGLENKYQLELSRDWKLLKNKRYMGTSIVEQHIRTTAKPWIMEMEGEGKEDTNQGPSESIKMAEEPAYTILKEPPEGHPEYLVADMHLPKLKTAATLTLDIGEDRIVLQTRSLIYGLDIYLPYDIIQEDAVAQFNRKTKVLSITMPVQPC